MEKNLSLQTKINVIALLSSVAECLHQPFELLRQYYAHVLERPINNRQMWLLINAQAAFLFAAFPTDGPLLLRTICCAWFLHAVVLCKRSLS